MPGIKITSRDLKPIQDFLKANTTDETIKIPEVKTKSKTRAGAAAES